MLLEGGDHLSCLDVAVAIQNGTTALLGMTRERLAKFIEWETGMRESISIEDGLNRFKLAKSNGALNPQYLRTLEYAGEILRAELAVSAVHADGPLASC